MKKVLILLSIFILPLAADAHVWYVGSAKTYTCHKASDMAKKYGIPSLASPASGIIWAKTRAYRYFDHWERGFPGIGKMVAVKMQPTPESKVMGYVWFSTKKLCMGSMYLLENHNK